MIGDTRDNVRRLLRHGLTDKEMAAKLGLHYGTIKYHVRRILDECGARNRTQAALRIAQQGERHG